MKFFPHLFLTFFAVYEIDTKVEPPKPTMGDCFDYKAETPKQFKNYVILGHIYQDETKVNHQIGRLNFYQFDQIWLGGYLLIEATKSRSNLDYLGCLFDLSDPRTKWALGNHDVRSGNVKWITEKELHFIPAIQTA